VGISEVRRGFEWAGPGTTHLVLGSIGGSGLLEAQGTRKRFRPGDLVLSPAGVSRRFATRAALWKFLAIRLSDVERWQHLRQRGVQPLPSHWLGRILAPVEGMLAEHPLGGAVEVHTQTFPVGGENPLEYLTSRYGDRLARPGSDENPWAPSPDAFELHATILRRQVEGMLAKHPASGSDDEAVALASLWSRVVDRPRGPWDAQDLASALGVSRTTLYRMVKRQHGTSPAKLVERLRMDTACRLLSESRLSIEVIADQVGYANAFSFSAAFKRVVGEPPSLFRRDAARVSNTSGSRQKPR
jgi:AraC-like DNA-binding protein